MAHSTRIQPNSHRPFLRPPLDGSLTFPELFEFHASQNPDYPLYVYADDGPVVRTITYSEAYRAICRAGDIVSNHYMDAADRACHTERNTDARPVFGILASADTITYATLLVGINHTGCTAFPLSLRNSPAAIAHLLKVTGVLYMFVGDDPSTQSLASAAIALLAAEDVNIIALPMPHFEDVYNDGQGYHHVRIRPVEKDMISLVFHSSGSTNFPKPIPLTSRNLVAWGLLFNDGIDMGGFRIAVHALPVFHPMGLAATIWPICIGTEMACFKPVSPPTMPTPEALLDTALASQCEILYCVPSFIETWARDPGSMEKVKDFKAVMYSGAPLNKEIGDRLVATGPQLIALWGSTEAGGLNLIGSAPTKWEWNYFQLGKHFGTKLIPQTDQEGVYELVILTSSTFSPNVINTSVDGVPGWSSGDLIEAHPTRHGFFCIHGRADDQLMLSTGEKTNPAPLEHILRQDDNIQSAIMFGRGRFQNGVIVQPKVPFNPRDEDKLVQFRNAIWPTVLKLNDFSPTHSRLFKEMILVTDPGKPLLMTPKGTPQRRTCLEAYQQEIENLYHNIENVSQLDIQLPKTWTAKSTLGFVRENVQGVMKARVKDEDDLFQHGCDSLQATWIRNTVIHALRVSTKVSVHQLPLTFVYSHPSIRALSTFLYRVIQGNPHSLDQDVTVETNVKAMLELLDKYSANLTDTGVKSSLVPPVSQDETVVLTGCTGRLGTHILACLIHDKNVRHVYALNREPSGKIQALQERQRSAFGAWGLDPGLVENEKLTFVICDFGATNLGLTKETYDKVAESATTIVHNAWRVDFNVGLSTFEPLVAGMQTLINLALRAARPGGARLLFTSSIAVLLRHPASGAALEGPHDPQVAVGTGYGESKWVAEQLLLKAREVASLRATVVRVGQLSGDTQMGGWNKKEWVPALVSLGIFLGALPSKPDTLTWLPVDVAATVLLQMVRSAEPVLHLVSPNPVPWVVVFGAFARRLRVPLIPYDGWIERLRQVSNNDIPEELVSAWSLIDFFTSMGGVGASVSVSTERAVTESPILANVEPLGDGDVEKYLNYWKVSGLPL
ncbi:acetyl-CoA synthetase-like protein [Amylostereum chailletii]|nr:acetyl-CoA synthetase-like protein [Amylostereum chailletii]